MLTHFKCNNVYHFIVKMLCNIMKITETALTDILHFVQFMHKGFV